MLDGHFDFGNGYHGRVYLNPHQLFRYPSTIWRFAQDLLDVLPASVLDRDRSRRRTGDRAARCSRTRWRGCSTAGAPSTRPPTMFAPFMVDAYRGPGLSRFYRQQIAGRKCCSWTTCGTPGRRWRGAPTIVRFGGRHSDRDRGNLRPDGVDRPTPARRTSRSPNTRHLRTTPPVHVRCQGRGARNDVLTQSRAGSAFPEEQRHDRQQQRHRQKALRRSAAARTREAILRQSHSARRKCCSAIGAWRMETD